jgi:hypothetical protein
MNSTIINLAAGTITLTADVEDFRAHLDGHGTPSDMDRSQLRAAFRTFFTDIPKGLLDSARRMRSAIAEVLAAFDNVEIQDVNSAEWHDAQVAELTEAIAVVTEAVEQVEEVAPAADLIEQIQAAVKAKAPRKTRVSKWNQIVDDMINLYGVPSEDQSIVTVTQEIMESMNVPAAARKYPAYWAANPAGRAALALGWKASLRKVKGSTDRVLILTRIAAD